MFCLISVFSVTAFYLSRDSVESRAGGCPTGAAGEEADIWQGRMEGQEHSLSVCAVMSSGSYGIFGNISLFTTASWSQFSFWRRQALNSTPGRHRMALRDHSHVGSWVLVRHQEPPLANAAGPAMLAPWEILYIKLSLSWNSSFCWFPICPHLNSLNGHSLRLCYALTAEGMVKVANVLILLL